MIKLIKLTGLDSKEYILNAEHIEKLEQIPESMITLTNGKKYLVKESNDEIVRKVVHIAKLSEKEPKLSQKTILEINQARKRIKEGNFYSEEEAKKILGV